MFYAQSTSAVISRRYTFCHHILLLKNVQVLKLVYLYSWSNLVPRTVQRISYHRTVIVRTMLSIRIHTCSFEEVGGTLTRMPHDVLRATHGLRFCRRSFYTERWTSTQSKLNPQRKFNVKTCLDDLEHALRVVFPRLLHVP